KEMVRVVSLNASYAKNDVLENQGEKKLLANILEDNGCDELLSEASCQDILKVKKHYFKKLHAMGMELFWHGLKTLLSLHKLLELNHRGEVGVYLKSILTDLEQKMIPTLRKRVEYVKQSISHAKRLVMSSKSQIINHFQLTLDKLIQTLKSLHTTDSPDNVFPFYNWLETK
ncbi:MAG: hypothetical protein Q8905_12155, partial [Bacteroidota bacterium]|nr:hypothetical protein [Bacteroidota bacterium]